MCLCVFIFIHLKFFHHSEINKVCKCENTHKRPHTDSNVGGRALALMWDLVMLLVFLLPCSHLTLLSSPTHLVQLFPKVAQMKKWPPFDKRFPIWYEFCFLDVLLRKVYENHDQNSHCVTYGLTWVQYTYCKCPRGETGLGHSATECMLYKGVLQKKKSGITVSVWLFCTNAWGSDWKSEAVITAECILNNRDFPLLFARGELWKVEKNRVV